MSSSNHTTSSVGFTGYNSNPSPPEGRILFVSSLPDEITTSTLEAAFVQFGPLLHCELPLDKNKGTPRGFAFIEFEDADDAKHAIENMNLSELFGRVIRVNFARDAQKITFSRGNKPVWADEFYYRQQLASEGLEVDEEQFEEVESGKIE